MTAGGGGGGRAFFPPLSARRSKVQRPFSLSCSTLLYPPKADRQEKEKKMMFSEETLKRGTGKNGITKRSFL